MPGLSKAAVELAAEAEAHLAAPALVTPAAQEAERLREKFPSLLRVDTAPVAEGSGLSILPKPQVHAEEEVDETRNVVAVRQAAGAGVARSAPRLDASARPNGGSARIRNIDSFWPKRKRPGQVAPAVAVQPAPSVEPVAPAVMVPRPEPDPVLTTAAEVPAPVSILKSGVVDGMAYTLYSDGSIEAQLPQGRLRFGSITELRNHIEQSA
jgi:hypothetical protein